MHLISRPNGLLLSAALVFCAAPAFCETPEAIFGKATERYEKRLASIQTLTIVQEVMGIETTSRLQKQMVDGRAALVPSGAEHAGDLGTLYHDFNSLAKGATVEGSEDVDNQACWVVRVPDVGDLEVSADASEDFEPQDGRFWIDKDSSVLRRMEMTGISKSDGNTSPVVMEMHLADYREVDGWLHPFLMEMSLGGVDGQESPEIEKMREGLKQMEAEMANMPEDQRRMMEQMMKSRMPDLEKMTEGGKMTIAITVKEIRVNESGE